MCCTNRLTLLWVCVVLSSLIYTPVDAKNSRAKTRKKENKNFVEKKRLCERGECVHLVPLEAQNCVNRCISQECYESIYAADPLEDGEIDTTRGKRFGSCARNNGRKSKKTR
ncbi:unnamed protein product [Choristocarpus tenellus]